jgi:myo-inositol-hexaphosphate 3-phosphohydrolase
VALQLQNILARKRMGCRKVNGKARINNVAIVVTQINQSGFARLQSCIGNGKGKLLQACATDTDNTYAGFARRGSNSNNGDFSGCGPHC